MSGLQQETSIDGTPHESVLGLITLNDDTASVMSGSCLACLPPHLVAQFRDIKV